MTKQRQIQIYIAQKLRINNRQNFIDENVNPHTFSHERTSGLQQHLSNDTITSLLQIFFELYFLQYLFFYFWIHLQKSLWLYPQPFALWYYFIYIHSLQGRGNFFITRICNCLYIIFSLNNTFYKLQIYYAKFNDVQKLKV